jgi:hypothetical protein
MTFSAMKNLMSRLQIWIHCCSQGQEAAKNEETQMADATYRKEKQQTQDALERANAAWQPENSHVPSHSQELYQQHPN